ncbi:LegC family aminotransferase [Nitrosophilus labii]|uniref:LegC family aminotransferase n=1 Tax=Nitrosophilus labii TaxID=2706014 RepID=UPI0016575DF7|nr:LegC family aminotransferase [Nitrosophilus labii]
MKKNKNFKKIINFIKSIYTPNPKSKPLNPIIPLHEPVFIGNEKKYVCDTIESTFVSSVGEYVNRVEEWIGDFTGAKYAIATVNGTSALHIALILVGVDENSEVITQPLTFVATVNAINYTGAKPVFIDVDLDTLGLSPDSLKLFLEQNCEIKNNQCINKKTGKIIKACVPMHTFGHPCKIVEIKEICDEWNIVLIEDAAESLGSFYKNKHTGTFGKIGVFSFNGNKIVTSGGGGIIVTDDEELAKRAKHLTTTAKVSHKWEYFHDEIGYNYRMPNINAALLLAQLENLDKFLKIKRDLAFKYKEFFESLGIKFVNEPQYAKSNFWLNAIMFDNKEERDEFLEYSNNNDVMTRPIWRLMNKLPMYKSCQRDSLKNADYLEERVVNIPSGVLL